MAKAAQAASAPKAAATPAPAAAPAAAKGKSIVDPKYRNKYKATDKDWLAKFLDEQATKTRDKKVTEGDGEKQVTKTVKVPDGVDVDALFTLAAKNHLDVKKFEAQRTSHGFGGRFRMTVRNMLQTVIKQRHGVFNTGGTFLTAPPIGCRPRALRTSRPTTGTARRSRLPRSPPLRLPPPKRPRRRRLPASTSSQRPPGN
jgi:hypothetical protein